MKNLKTILYLIGTLIFTSCSDSPQSIAKKYLEAISSNKLDAAKNLSTPEVQEAINKSIKYIDPAKATDKIHIKIIRDETNGRISIVHYKKIMNDKESDFDHSIGLLKTDGKWLVSDIKRDNRKIEKEREIESMLLDTNRMIETISSMDGKNLNPELLERKKELSEQLSNLKKRITNNPDQIEKIKIKEDIASTYYNVIKLDDDVDFSK